MNQDKAEELLEEEFSIIISNHDNLKFKRLDHLLSHYLQSKSRTFIKSLFERNLIEANIKLSLSKVPPEGTKITIQIPPPLPLEAIAQDLPLDILFEDEHLIIINKSAGIVTHPAPGNYTGTLVNAILYHCKTLKGIGGSLRPGIVHRLDKGTSGVMVIAKSDKAMEGLIEQFSDHSIHRKYEALILGSTKKEQGKVETLIARSTSNRLKMSSKVKKGKTAITHYQVLNQFDSFSHIELKLETGRTHQIRVHMSEVLQCPILCDPAYGNLNRQLKHFSNKKIIEIMSNYSHPFLHAKELGFTHPITKEKVFFKSSPPKEFQSILKEGQS